MLLECKQIDTGIIIAENTMPEGGEISAGEARRRSSASHAEGIALYEQGDLHAAMRCFQEALQLAQHWNDMRGVGAALHEIARIAGHWRNFEQAAELARGAARAVSLAGCEAHLAVQGLAIYDQLTGNFGEAEAMLLLVRESCEARCDLVGLGQCLHELGLTAAGRGGLDEAVGYFIKALSVKRVSGDSRGLATTRQILNDLLARNPPGCTASGAETRGGGDVSAAALLDRDLIDRLHAQQADPYHIPAAGRTLEEALTMQFRALALGLFADRLLRGEVPGDDEWWYQYASIAEPLAPPPPDEVAAGLERLGEMGFQDPATPWEHAQVLFQTVRASLTAESAKRAAETDRATPAFQAFQRSFKLDVALRRVRAISPPQACEIPIRIYGGEVALWQEGRINRQLCDLGSALRYCFEGARQYRIRNIRAAVGLDTANVADPPCFVLGEAGPVSAVGRASFVEFQREFAVSPYLGRAPGYSEGMKAVVRRVVPLRFPIDPAGHELAHAFRNPDQGSGLVSWRAVLRDDICRYCQIPRKFENIAYQFARAFGFNMTSTFGANSYPPGESPEELPLYEIVRKLRDDELLVWKEGRYYCPLFEEGRRWHLA